MDYIARDVAWSQPIQPVDEVVVRRTMAHLQMTIAAMVELQLRPFAVGTPVSSQASVSIGQRTTEPKGS